MGIRDRNIDWLRQKYILPPAAFMSSCTVSGSTLLGMAAGNPVLTELSDFGYGGFVINQSGDAGATLDFGFSGIFDPRHEIGVRVLYTLTAAGASTDDVQWVVTYDQADYGEALAAPGTALDTPCANQVDTGGTQFELKRSPRGIISADKFDFTARDSGIAWKVTTIMGNFAGDELSFLGLALDYIPLVCENAHENIDVFKDLSEA